MKTNEINIIEIKKNIFAEINSKTQTYVIRNPSNGNRNNI